MPQFSNPHVSMAYEIAMKDIKKDEQNEKKDAFNGTVLGSDQLTLLTAPTANHQSEESQIFDFVQNRYTQM